MRLTEEQQAARDAGVALSLGESLRIMAFAGAGKTTTLKSIARGRRDRGLYVAFNKSIAVEAKSKLATTKCDAMTIHSLAHQVTRDMMEDGPTQINARLVRESGVLARHNFPHIRGWRPFQTAAAVQRTLSNFCASDATEILETHAREALIASLGDPDFMRNPVKREVIEDKLRRMTVPLVEMTSAFSLWCAENGKIGHDLYLKMLDLDETMRARAFIRYKYLMIDEAQDINPVQRSILTKTGLPLIAVGDSYQQIYSWRGAENALQELPGEQLFLTQSFRFGENIAEIARHILATRPDGGPIQQLQGLGNGAAANHRGPQVAFICRTNMGVIDEALRLMNQNYSIKIDNIKSLLEDVSSAQALYEGHLDRVTSPDLRQFDSWHELRSEAEEGDPGLMKIVNLIEQDRAEAIEKLAKHQKTGSRNPQVELCTAHRSKGLEWPNVKLGGDWKDIPRMNARMALAENKSERHKTLAMEEWNTLYVAATRPQSRLGGHQRILFPKPKDAEEEIDRYPEAC